MTEVIGKTLTPEQKLRKANVFLMNDPRYALFSGLMLLGETKISKKVPTARTDGFNTEYNPDFIDELTQQQLRGLVLHENMHKGFKHLVIWKHLYEENHKLANMACDHVINLLIQDSDPTGADVSLPEGGCCDPRFKGMSAKQVFDLLKKAQQGEGGGGFDEHDWENSQEITEQVEEQIEEAMRQGSMRAKMLGNGNATGIRELEEMLAPKVKWEDELCEFVKSVMMGTDSSTWKKPSRKWVHQDVYLPSMVSESVGPLVIGVDTSGSIGGDELTRFLSEVVYVCNVVFPERVDLLYWGSGIAGHETYFPGDYEGMINSTRPADSGGTHMHSVVGKVAELRKSGIDPCAVIILTDGYVEGWYGADKFGCPVLYGVTSKGVTPTAGRGLYIGEG